MLDFLIIAGLLGYFTMFIISAGLWWHNHSKVKKRRSKIRLVKNDEDSKR